jgi:hypothetical protein
MCDLNLLPGEDIFETLVLDFVGQRNHGVPPGFSEWGSMRVAQFDKEACGYSDDSVAFQVARECHGMASAASGCGQRMIRAFGEQLAVFSSESQGAVG